MSVHFWIPIFAGNAALTVFEPETSAYLITIGIPNDNTIFYASTPQEITGAQIWTAVNNYVLALKAADIAGQNWDNIGTATCTVLRDYLFIGGTATRHAYNLADSTKNLNFFGSWTHNALGIIGNGSNTYANDGIRNTNLTDKREVYHGLISSDGGSPAGGGMWVYGARTAPGNIELSALRVGSNLYLNPNTGILSGNIFTAVSLFTGDLSQRRTSASGNNNFNYFNGTQIAQSNVGTTVPNDINLDLYVGALNQNNNLVNPFLGGIRHHFIANHATLAQHNAWYAARIALATALNRVP